MQIGKTKIFLRAGQMAELDARRTEVLSGAAKKIQRQTRTHQAQKRFTVLRKATISLQALCRVEPSDFNRALWERLKHRSAMWALLVSRTIKVQRRSRRHR